MDKTYIRYHILPTSERSIHVFGYFGSDSYMLDILKINMGDSLPIKKTAYVPKFIPEVRIVFKDGLVCWNACVKIGRDRYNNIITVSVDEDNFEYLQVENIGIDIIETIPSNLGILKDIKVPFIGFFDNTSVISVYKESKGYEFLDKWNGKFGEEMFISFDEVKPKFGQAAMDVLKRKPGFVVFDLLKIMAIDPENVTSASHWGFKITNDAQNPILIQFKNYCGGIRAASPAFLLALILRQQLKVIENETGVKPTKIAVCIIEKSEYKEGGTEAEEKEGGEGVTNNEEAEDEEKEEGVEESLIELNEEMKRMKEGFEEACKLLKVECIFANEQI